jgi:phage tail protein X
MLREKAATLPDVAGVAVTLPNTTSAAAMGSLPPTSELRTIHTDTVTRIAFRINANTRYLHTAPTGRSALHAAIIRRTDPDATTSEVPV